MMLVEDVTEHRLELDVVTAGCLFHLLARNQVYRQCFSKFWLKQRLSDLRLRIQLQESILKLIDYSGGQIANKEPLIIRVRVNFERVTNGQLDEKL